MKKILIIVVIVASLIIGGAFVFSELENKTNIIGPSSITSAKNKEPEESNLKLTSNLGSGSEHGYYYLKSQDSYTNIKYYDYTGKQEIYLCNKPNCQHNTEQCNSYLGQGGFKHLLVHNDKLYLVETPIKKDKMSGSDNSGQMASMQATEEEAPIIYKMDLDGTNKTKLTQVQSGVSLANTYITYGNYLYMATGETKKIQGAKNTTTSITKNRKMVRINIEDGKQEEVCSIGNKQIMGTYEKKLIFSEIQYSKSQEEMAKLSDAEYIKIVNNSKIKLSTWDVETQKENVFLEDQYKNIGVPICYLNQIYFSMDKSNKIEYTNIENGERGVVIESIPNKGNFSLGEIHDGKMLCYYFEEKNLNAGFLEACYVDLEKKEIKDFTLLTQKPKGVVDILGETKDYYFVRSEYKSVDQHIAWKNVTQIDIQETYYSLIKKEDYWNSKAEYITMKNTNQ